MIEHRLIERMIAILAAEIARVKVSGNPDVIAIDHAVDFIRVYADQTHHGKEEDILFRELRKKDQSDEHRQMMADLEADHVKGRATTRALVAAKDRFVQGDTSAVAEIVANMEVLVDFYPKHIEKEDKHYFVPAMQYFTKQEQDALLEEGRAFDRKMIHRTYEAVVVQHEARAGLGPSKMKANWLDFL